MNDIEEVARIIKLGGKVFIHADDYEKTVAMLLKIDTFANLNAIVIDNLGVIEKGTAIVAKPEAFTDFPEFPIFGNQF